MKVPIKFEVQKVESVGVFGFYVTCGVHLRDPERRDLPSRYLVRSVIVQAWLPFFMWRVGRALRQVLTDEARAARRSDSYVGKSGTFSREE
jgi:hypothetical protein